jgi:hypothetical protein
MNVRRSLRNLPVVLLLSGVAMIGMATPALAHAELVASTPAEGAKLAAAPKQVKLTFNEPVTPAADPLTVAGPGAEWTIGKAVVGRCGDHRAGAGQRAGRALHAHLSRGFRRR